MGVCSGFSGAPFETVPRMRTDLHLFLWRARKLAQEYLIDIIEEETYEDRGFPARARTCRQGRRREIRLCRIARVQAHLATASAQERIISTGLYG